MFSAGPYATASPSTSVAGPTGSGSGDRDRDGGEVPAAVRNGEWSFTRRPLLRVAHTWVLEQRALLGGQWALYKSRRFAAQEDDDVTWQLSLEADYPFDKPEGALVRPETLRVCVSFGTGISHKRVHFRALLRAQQEAIAPDADVEVERALPASPDDMVWADPHQRQFIGELFLLDSDRSLAIRVDIVYMAGPQEACRGPPGTSSRVPRCSLADDLETLLNESRGSDTVLVADGREWRVHKAILSARSPVFAAMFQHGMTEANTNRVTIEQVSADVLDQVLRYLYSGRVDHLHALGVEMLSVADRYALPRLKALCEEELAATVTEANALEVLVTADLHSAKELRDVALECVCSNIHQILGSAAWKDVAAERPHLLHQVLAKCVNCRLQLD